jgi:F420-dependent oxidoreductase-like protein
MRIGLTGSGSTVEKVVAQAKRAESDGFSSLWYTSAGAGDPLTVMAFAGRETTKIELGTAIQPTYPIHPVAMASQAASAAMAIGAPGRFTLGVGPSHQPFVEELLGLSYAHPGRHTEEYLQILAPLLRGQSVRFDGEDYHVSSTPPPLIGDTPVPILLAALGPRLLRVAGQQGAGTIPWMANAKAIRSHVAPRITQAAADAGHPPPRIVAGLPVAVHDDVGEARDAAQSMFEIYGTLVNYQRIFTRGGIDGPGDAALVGDEVSVAAQVEELFAAGATDVWAAVYPVGDDKAASRARTRALLKELANS